MSTWLFVVALLLPSGGIDFVVTAVLSRDACEELREEFLKGPSPYRGEPGCYQLILRPRSR